MGMVDTSEHVVEVYRDFSDNSVTNIAIKFIEENYKQKINVKDVADHVHMIYSQVSRLFKSYLGESIKQYINKIRIINAQYLLKYTDRDIVYIAGETGFQSENYFCEAFKKYTGMSPVCYRRNKSRSIE